ncbi:MAG: peptidoglycan DD-metalloendopeptidase family protein [Deltaproteobacteria bacterium]|nr:peptidoglycan DD-metalloendopeptidase family protein [Deltaproteobacteria bacterium]
MNGSMLFAGFSRSKILAAIGFAWLAVSLSLATAQEDPSGRDLGGATSAPTPAPTPDLTAKARSNEKRFLFARDEFYVARVVLDRSLFASLIELMPDNVGLARQLASSSQDILRHVLDTQRQMARGDAAIMVFKDPGQTQAVRLYGLRYESAALGRPVMGYYFWEPNRSAPEYFDENGNAYLPRLRRSPIEGYTRLGRLFGQGNATFTEIMADKGTEIIAPFPARVVRVNWRPKEQGDCVELEYLGTGVFATFAGLESVSIKVTPGAELDAGALIAKVGALATGQPTGLRYELHSAPGDDAPRIDPFAFHLSDPYRMNATNLVLFRVVKTKIDELFGAAMERAKASAPPN